MSAIEARTTSVDDTRALAGELAGLARAGDIILLAGDLGAGKTAFVQGFALALGVQDQVTSPTFTLVHTYEGGRLPVVHADAWRLDHLQEMVDLGITELVDDGAVALVEWGDMVEPALPADFLEVRIEPGEADDERRMQLRAVGPAWSARLDEVARAVGSWSC